MTLLGLVGGATIGMVALRPTYQSAAQVLVHRITDDPTETPEPVSTEVMGTERELVSADGVVELVRHQTGWTGSPNDLRRPLSVAVVGDTRTLSIGYQADHPEKARLGAQLFAEAYLTYRSSMVDATRDGSRQSLEAALRGVTDRLNKTRATLPATAPGAEAANDALSQEAAPYQAKLAEVNVVNTNAPGSIVAPASLPSSLSGPGTSAAAAIGAVLGLLTGLATTRLRGAVDRRLRGRGDLEAHLGAPVLASVPRTRREGLEETTLVTLAMPDGPAAEAYRQLRARIVAMADRWGLKTVMVASPTSESGTTAIAANLAVSMAAAGKRVALLSADLRSPGLHRYFGVDNDRGLSNVLIGEAAPCEVAHAPQGLETLQVMPAGPALAEPTDLLGSGPMRVVLDERSEVSDFVVLEAPPALQASEALTLAPMVDGIVVVADARHATRDEIAEIGDQLRLVGGNVVGAVICNLG
jgi:capsular exopolysaccharide synthesis family protein